MSPVEEYSSTGYLYLSILYKFLGGIIMEDKDRIEVVSFVDPSYFGKITEEEARQIKAYHHPLEEIDNCSTRIEDMPKLDESKMLIWNKLINQPRSLFDKRAKSFNEIVTQLQKEYDENQRKRYERHKNGNTRRRKKYRSYYNHKRESR